MSRISVTLYPLVSDFCFPSPSSFPSPLALRHTPQIISTCCFPPLSLGLTFTCCVSSQLLGAGDKCKAIWRRLLQGLESKVIAPLTLVKTHFHPLDLGGRVLGSFAFLWLPQLFPPATCAAYVSKTQLSSKGVSAAQILSLYHISAMTLPWSWLQICWVWAPNWQHLKPSQSKRILHDEPPCFLLGGDVAELQVTLSLLLTPMPVVTYLFTAWRVMRRERRTSFRLLPELAVLPTGLQGEAASPENLQDTPDFHRLCVLSLWDEQPCCRSSGYLVFLSKPQPLESRDEIRILAFI